MKDSRFYVYAFYDVFEDGLPFYIGKGQSKRYLDHFKARFLAGDTMFYCKLRSMLASGNEPEVEFPAIMITSEAACELEIALIKQYGRRDLGTGCLCNHTDGGEGQAGRFMSFETREKISQTKREQGREATIDERIAISRALVGRKESVVTRLRKRESRLDCLAVYSYDLRTEERIKTYPSVSSVREDKFTPANVHKVIRGDRRHHGGLGWRMV